MAERLLEVNNLCVQYNAFHALMHLTFHIDRGEMVALLGSNGAGKTTTMKTISGIKTQTEGSILFEGTDVSHLPVEKRAALGIVQKPEGRRLFPEMTIMDNLLVGSYLKPCREKRKENLERCFTYFPKLYERREQLAGSMSGGEQEMCAIARALMQNPKLLMLDEPLNGIDMIAREDVTKSIVEGITKESAVIISSHLIEDLEPIADYVLFIKRGQLVVSGQTATFRDQYGKTMSDMYREIYADMRM